MLTNPGKSAHLHQQQARGYLLREQVNLDSNLSNSFQEEIIEAHHENAFFVVTRCISASFDKNYAESVCYVSERRHFSTVDNNFSNEIGAFVA